GSPPQEKDADTDETQHRVTLTRGFHMAAHLVTQYQWEEVMGPDRNPSHFRGKDEGEKKRLPVDNVTWDECRRFCAELRRREGHASRLPTEAEWEYACRAGTTTAFWWGDEFSIAHTNAKEKLGNPTPVDGYAPNPWGLYDVHGNLCQWCADWYAVY